jgi:nucleoside-diphosphate-sugar epimerase
VAQLALEAQSKQLIFVSSCSVLGDFFSGVRDETCDFSPESEYAASKVRCEKWLTEWATQTGTKLTIVRPPLIYGAFDRGAMKMMIEMIRDGKFLILGSGNNLKSLVNVRTLSQFILKTMSNELAYGQCFIVTDGKPYSLNEICRTISDQTHSRKWIPHVPLVICKMMSGVLRLTEGVVPLSVKSHDIEKFTSSNTYSSAKAENVLGFRPNATLVDGIQDELKLISH